MPPFSGGNTGVERRLIQCFIKDISSVSVRPVSGAGVSLEPGMFSASLFLKCTLFTLLFFFFFFFTFYDTIVPIGFLPQEIRIAFPGESQLRQSRAIQVTVHAGCLSVSIIHFKELFKLFM